MPTNPKEKREGSVVYRSSSSSSSDECTRLEVTVLAMPESHTKQMSDSYNLRGKAQMNDFVITFDVDWAPDFAIDLVTSTLKANQLRSTWFVTHQSAAVDRLRLDPDLFELGIHPNLLPGSTQGDTPTEILSNLLSIVPQATSIRTHALVQSSHLLETIITQTALKVDSSLFIPYMPNLRPVEHYRNCGSLLRVPGFWADTYEMEKPDAQWSLAPFLEVPGLKVMIFHPIHIYLNSSDPAAYQAMKKQATALAKLKKDVADDYVQTGEGTRTFFSELIEHLASANRSLRLQDIYRIWNENRNQH